MNETEGKKTTIRRYLEKFRESHPQNFFQLKMFFARLKENHDIMR